MAPSDNSSNASHIQQHSTPRQKQETLDEPERDKNRHPE